MSVWSSFGRKWVALPAAQALNALGVSAFIQTLLDDADAATARTTLGAVGLTGNETVAGVKTFSSNPVVSGGGISFPATQAASADANTLDDYEEGTYTPTITFGGGATSLTYSLQVGRYVKIGRFVYIFGRIILSAKGSSTGNARVSGLPFTVEDIFGGQNVTMIGYYSNLASMSGPVSGLLPNNDTVFDIYIGGAAGVTQLTHSNFTNTSDFIWSGSYRASS